jgi:putative ABC transport system permease protein
LRLAILGAAAGAVSTLLLADVLQTHLYEVTPTDPLTWVMVGVVVLVTAALACWRPARRAGRVDLAGVLKRNGAWVVG